MKAFKTATAKNKATMKKRKDTPVTFTIDDEEYTAYPPKDAAFVLFAAAADGGANGMDSAVEMSRFLDACLDKKSANRIRDRLRDPEDSLDFASLTEVFEFLIAEFTGRPTGSPSA